MSTVGPTKAPAGSRRGGGDVRRRVVDVALGTRPPDLTVVGGRVLNVYSGRVEERDVLVAEGRIAALREPGEPAAGRVVDVEGGILVPGLIDAHLHLVSGQLPPAELARQLIAHGTVAVSACFYEAATVGGPAGFAWMLEQARGTPLRYWLAPFFSCYRGLGPFGGTERFTAEDFLALAELPETVEIREWNAWIDRLEDPALDAIVERARERGLVVAGHLEGMTGRELQASVASGAGSDHEAVDVEEALERVAAGVHVQIREGSAARNLDGILDAIVSGAADPRFFMFCTDGQETQHVLRDGHIDGLVRRAIAAGVPAVEAVRMGSLNAAQYLRRDHEAGSIAPGRIAHLAVVDDLDGFRVRDVVIADGLNSQLVPPEPAPAPAAFRDTVRLARPATAADFAVPAGAAETARVRVIGVTGGVLVTDELEAELDARDGALHADPERDLAKIAVLDRHHASGRRGLGFVTGFGLARGAIASSTSPALMNLVVLGVDDDDMAVAAGRVAAMGGGLVAVADGAVVAEVALPVFGLFSEQPFEETAAAMRSFEAALAGLGVAFPGALSTAGFVTMPLSIPGLKLCDRGLVRVSRTGSEPVDLVIGEPARRRPRDRSAEPRAH